MQKYIHLIRLDKPLAILLLFLPCLFGLALSVENIGNYYYLIIYFALGSLLMRSAGCVINDILDKNFDSQIARTKNRPIAANKVSKREAFILFAILVSLGFVVLLQFNLKVIFSGFAAFILLITYPLMKRITFYPQIFLGLAFNFGLLMAIIQINNSISLQAIILFLATIIWTVIYDGFYAFQDIEDDIKIGVKSCAIKFQKFPKFIFSCLAMAMFAAMILVGLIANYSLSYFLINFFIFLAQLIIIKKCNFADPKSCLISFKKNIIIGLLIFLSLIAK